jgi:hypothetical protein
MAGFAALFFSALQTGSEVLGLTKISQLSTEALGVLHEEEKKKLDIAFQARAYHEPILGFKSRSSYFQLHRTSPHY